MSDPLAYLAFNLAAADGTLNGASVRRLVTAGVALLRGSAPLVRAMSGRRSALLLPVSSSWVVALGASAGRSAVLLDPTWSESLVLDALSPRDVGAVFVQECAEPMARRVSLRRSIPVVLLDEKGTAARVIVGEEMRDVSLELHEGHPVTGDLGADGSDEEVFAISSGAGEVTPIGATHREILAAARIAVARDHLGARDHVLTMVTPLDRSTIVEGVVAPLLAGGRVTALGEENGASLVPLLEREGVSTLVAPATVVRAIDEATAGRGHPLDAPVLKRVYASGLEADPGLVATWEGTTSIPLRPLPRHASPPT